MENYSIQQLAEIFVDAILSETFLNKETLTPRIEALIKRFVDLKNIPKNYNDYESKTDRARRVRTIEKRGEEVRFWREQVKILVGEDAIQEYYKKADEHLAEKGFFKN